MMKVSYPIKIRFLIAGGLIAFGLYNIFSFFIFSPILSLPFPFEHTVAKYLAKGTASVTTDYEPFLTSLQDPYWLFWSLTLYFGFGFLAFSVIRLEKNFRRRAVIKSTKIAVITVAAGFALFVLVGMTVSFLAPLIIPEPQPYLEAEFENFKEIYHSGESIFFHVYLNGHDYTVSELEMRILDESGAIVWQGEPYIPWYANIDGPYNVGRDITDSQNPIIIFAPGKYTLEISLSGHTVTNSFVVEV